MKPNILILILILITPIIGCSEKISPSLQESNTGTDTDTDSGGDSDNDDDKLYYFKLTNTADASLGYKLHKTGSGNWNEDCSIESDSPLTNQTFIDEDDDENKIKDITCFLEAEELSIYHSGLKFKINSAPNTCNYISYIPFSYFNRMPGDSTTSYIQILCAGGANNDDVTTFAVDPDNISYRNMLEIKGGVYAGCGEYVNQDIPFFLRESINEVSPNFCRFKYSDKGKENCDVGTVNVTTYTLTKIDEDLILSGGTTVPTKCGGKVMDCVRGPIKLENPIAQAPYFRYISLQSADKKFELEKPYQGLIGQDEYKMSQSYFYANYRRELANKNIDYDPRLHFVSNLTIEEFDDENVIITSPVNFPASMLVNTIIKLEGFEWEGNNISGKVTSFISSKEIKVKVQEDFLNPVIGETNQNAFLTYSNSNYASSFNSLANLKSFDPSVLELYSKNRNTEDSGHNIDSTDWRDSFYQENKYYAKPYASDPYLGLGYYKTNPFYTFECLDAAYEPKARIRMLVRDWDRIFNIDEDSSDPNYLSFIENLTDVFNTSLGDFSDHARMDYVRTVDENFEYFYEEYDPEINFGNFNSSNFNDFSDWDDILPLEKNSNVYTPIFGEFHPNNFPEDYKVQ